MNASHPPTSPHPIAVTGASGGIGGRVARLLHAAGLPLRLVVRDPDRAPSLPTTAADGRPLVAPEIAVADYADPAAIRRALDGVDVALMVSAAESADRLAAHAAFIEAAASAGVQRLIYTSFFGAAPDATFTLARDHHVTERLIRDSGLAFTFLRDNLYTDFLPLLAGEDGVIRGPAGNGRVAAVTRDDVAESAAAVLRAAYAAAPSGTDPHVGATYELTGPEALTLGEVAAILTADRATRGEPAVRFEDETLAEAYTSRAAYGAPPWQLDAWVSTYTAIAAGELARTTADVERLTGHRPRSLRELLAG